LAEYRDESFADRQLGTGKTPIGHLEELISVSIADLASVNPTNSEREQSRIIRGNFVVRDRRGLFFEVPVSVSMSRVFELSARRHSRKALNEHL
jgi:hypothetical protein